MYYKFVFVVVIFMWYGMYRIQLVFWLLIVAVLILCIFHSIYSLLILSGIMTLVLSKIVVTNMIYVNMSNVLWIKFFACIIWILVVFLHNFPDNLDGIRYLFSHVCKTTVFFIIFIVCVHTCILFRLIVVCDKIYSTEYAWY